jgi:hypothetical protein
MDLRKQDSHQSLMQQANRILAKPEKRAQKEQSVTWKKVLKIQVQVRLEEKLRILEIQAEGIQVLTVEVPATRQVQILKVRIVVQMIPADPMMEVLTGVRQMAPAVQVIQVLTVEVPATRQVQQEKVRVVRKVEVQILKAQAELVSTWCFLEPTRHRVQRALSPRKTLLGSA